jgi:hypothetical protein
VKVGDYFVAIAEWMDKKKKKKKKKMGKWNQEKQKIYCAIGRQDRRRQQEEMH